jgi:pilus assembly protein CpaC
MTAAYTTQLRRLRRATISTRAAGFNTTAALVVFFIIVILVAAPMAQQPQPAFTPGASSGSWTAASAPLPETATDIDLLVGRSTILNVGSAIARVSLTVPDVADAMVTAPSQLLIHGKQPGTISLFVWDRAGSIKTFEVKVRRDLTALAAQLKQLFPGEPIVAVGSGKDVVLSGIVSGQYVIDKAANVAGGYVEKKENVVNLLKQQEGVASNQVMLRVRFAEVSRTAMTELGASFFTGSGGFHDYVARSTTQQFSAPNHSEMLRASEQGVDKWGGGRDTVTATGGKQTFGDFLNLFIFNNKYNVGTVIKALQDKGLFQSLAEPNLIATNGKEASFLAGGEFPYPVVQGGAGGNSVTIMFKEFGIRLSFTPTVLGGDLINLKVKPEVSALDFANGVSVEGFRVPALTTRRTDTEVELRDGQTFAIAGLLNNTVTDTMRKIPGIGDIPILGWLFKSKAMQKQQTELVVMITPYIVRRGSTGVSEGLPTPVEPFLGAPSKSTPNPEPYNGSPRYPGGQAAPRTGTGASQQTAPVGAPGQTEPLASRPIQSDVPLVTVPEAVKVAPLTKQGREQARKAEQLQKEQDRRDADQRAAESKVEEKRRIEQSRLDAEQAVKDLAARKQAEKLEKERAIRDAEAARRKAEEDAKREKALTDAATRLKQAQAEYQTELEKTKEGSKPKSSGKVSAPSTPKR